jgi:hypothetical protein
LIGFYFEFFSINSENVELEWGVGWGGFGCFTGLPGSCILIYFNPNPKKKQENTDLEKIYFYHL